MLNLSIYIIVKEVCLYFRTYLSIRGFREIPGNFLEPFSSGRPGGGKIIVLTGLWLTVEALS